jgi:hypothetical protein
MPLLLAAQGTSWAAILGASLGVLLGAGLAILRIRGRPP